MEAWLSPALGWNVAWGVKYEVGSGNLLKFLTKISETFVSDTKRLVERRQAEVTLLMKPVTPCMYVCTYRISSQRAMIIPRCPPDMTLLCAAIGDVLDRPRR